MQAGGAGGPSNKFFLVAFNPDIGRSRVVRELSGDEAFAEFGASTPDTGEASKSINNRYIDLFQSPDGKYRAQLEFNPETGGYAMRIAADDSEIVRTNRGNFTMDRDRSYVYWEGDHGQPYRFSFVTGQQSPILQHAQGIIVGMKNDTLYAFPSSRPPDDHYGANLQRHNLISGEASVVEKLKVGGIAEAGNISRDWGWFRARMSDIGEGYTAFIDLKTEKIILQNIPESIFLKVISTAK